MNKTAIFGLFLMTSLLAGTAVNMNMFSPAMAAMGNGMGQYYDNNYQQSDMEMIHMEVAAMTQVTLR